jgi:hypothetical protein
MKAWAALPPDCGMAEWTRHDWILIVWYSWVAALVCSVIYLLFG